jgi:hypothetical protein
LAAGSNPGGLFAAVIREGEMAKLGEAGEPGEAPSVISLEEKRNTGTINFSHAITSRGSPGSPGSPNAVFKLYG